MAKRIASLVLALCILCGIALPAMAAEDDWVTLRVEVYDRSISGFNVEDCMQLHYVQENFGDPNHIKVEFVPIARWDEETLISTRLAGKTAPDLCMTYNNNLVLQYIDMGGILPLDDLLAEYGQTLSTFLGPEVLQYGQFDTGDGMQQYYLPSRRFTVHTRGMYIRQDWLDKLNMAAPTTPDELYAYLAAAKENKLGGESTVPYSADLYAQDPLYPYMFMLDAAIDYSKVTEEDWVSYYKFHEMLPEAREAFRFLNKCFNDGLMSSFFGMGDDDRIDRELILGNNGFFTGNWDAPWRTEKAYQQGLTQNVPEGKWTAVDCFKDMYGNDIHETYTGAGMAIFIPGWVEEKVAVAAVKYLNWMSEFDNMYFLQHGVQGVNYYTVDEYGIPLDTVSINDTPDEYKMHARDVVGISGICYATDEANSRATALGFPGYEDEVTKSIGYSLEGGYEPVSFTRTIQARVDYGSMVTAKEAEFVVQVVTCKAEDFDKVYDEYIQAILDVGGQQIIDEQRQAYQEGAYRGFYPYKDKQ